MRPNAFTLLSVRRRVERKFAAAYPGVTLAWTMPLKRNPNGTAGGRLALSLEGYRSKVALIYVNKDGSWEST